MPEFLSEEVRQGQKVTISESCAPIFCMVESVVKPDSKVS